MRIDGRTMQTAWPAADGFGDMEGVDQTRRPHALGPEVGA